MSLDTQAPLLSHEEIVALALVSLPITANTKDLPYTDRDRIHKRIIQGTSVLRDMALEDFSPETIVAFKHKLADLLALANLFPSPKPA